MDHGPVARRFCRICAVAKKGGREEEAGEKRLCRHEVNMTGETLPDSKLIQSRRKGGGESICWFLAGIHFITSDRSIRKRKGGNTKKGKKGKRKGKGISLRALIPRVSLLLTIYPIPDHSVMTINSSPKRKEKGQEGQLFVVTFAAVLSTAIRSTYILVKKKKRREDGDSLARWFYFRPSSSFGEKKKERKGGGGFGALPLAVSAGAISRAQDSSIREKGGGRKEWKQGTKIHRCAGPEKEKKGRKENKTEGRTAAPECLWQCSRTRRAKKERRARRS